MTTIISVILNLIQNQLDPVRQLADRQDDVYSRIMLFAHSRLFVSCSR